ncbi:RNA ligase family protein [Streptomyces sp. JL4002]|uniref:RNA ligase family protein n=1 Tax=Streptomyces sp. JL4002 TaxID=3404781 RepID=UPI003B28BD2C
MRTSYPRTPHLPWSPGASVDDVRSTGPAGLAGREVVVTEKLDGENTTLYADGLHARSLDSGHHPSRAWVKALQGRIGPGIPAGWRVCGENLHARHSIPYEDLDSWFYGFSVWDGENCLDWDRTVRFLHGLGVPVPRVLWRGRFDERTLRGLRLDTGRQEGYVVRTTDGFTRADFGSRVAKWVRAGHVRTDTHWMFAEVVPNGLGAAAPLWAVRSGAGPDVAALSAAVGADLLPGAPVTGEGPGADAVAEEVSEVTALIDGSGRTGDARLAGVLAALLHRAPRARVMARLAAGPAGMRLARQVADLVGLYPYLTREFPDEERRAGLVRMAAAADLGVLHALAGAFAEGATERECVEWSALCAEEAGLFGPDPLGPLRTGLREALAGLDADAADRCWAEVRRAVGRGRVGGCGPLAGDGLVEEAVAASWQWRDGSFPRLVRLCGPSGSGKSTFGRDLPGVSTCVSLDDLRGARGSRADQRANAEVVAEGLHRLDAALRAGGTVVWDATSLTGRQREPAGAVARRRDALVTDVVVLVDEPELRRRNAVRTHPVPERVLTSQLHRFGPPYAGGTHRTWYVGPAGTVEDTAGSLGAAAVTDVLRAPGTLGASDAHQ